MTAITSLSDQSIEHVENDKMGYEHGLETIDDEYPEKEYKIKIRCPEFTCLCPGKPDQPDFATMIITYVPDEKLIELRSLKYYLFEYRDEEIYHEEATNKILEDLKEALEPRYLRVKGDWNVRGGIKTIVETEHVDEDWEGDPSEVELRSSEALM